MDLSEFRKDLLEEVRSTASVYGEGSSAAFASIIANYLVNADVLPDFEPAFYLGSGSRNRRLRVDGYVLDEFDFTMNLIVVDYSGENEPPTLTRSEAEQIFEWPIRFVDEVFNNDLQKRIEISTSAADLADLLLINRSRIRKFRILLFTDGTMSGRIESFPIKKFEGLPVECQIWDVQRLFNIIAVSSGRESIEINFKDYLPSGIPCLEASNSDVVEYRCYLCVVPGQLIADIYDRYGAQLLERNVRSFLSTKVAVNKKIRQTILVAPKMFFAFNNGISATATEVVVESSHEGKFITYVRDFQIINGGQTTASLSNARYRDKADLSQINLQMKLTEINAEDEDATNDLIQKISQSSNSQNKVSDADFFSTHPFHIRMEQISRRLFAPAVGGAQHDTHWFYERARGQYLQEQMRLTPSEKKRFLAQNPKNQLFTKTDLAKVYNSWNKLPHIVSKGAQTNFLEFAKIVDKEWTNDDTSFNERYFQESVALLILFKHVEKSVSSEDWYENGYRANIVTYSIALLSHLIQNQYPDKTLDFQLIWNKQEVPRVLADQMRVIAKEVSKSITDPLRETINVTQWCKREACWNRIKELPIQLDSSIEQVLVDKEEYKANVRIARKEQKLISGIEAQTQVVNYGADFWKRLYKFIVEKRIVNQPELDALKIACKIPHKLPNSIHSQHLLALLDKAKSEGWSENG